MDPNDIRADSYLAQPGCRVYHSVAQAIANAVFATVALDSEWSDQFGMHDVAVNNNRITINVGGRYSIGGVIAWAANAVGARAITLRQNGATIFAGQFFNAVAGGLLTACSCHCIRDFVSGDWAELYVYQSSGGALNITRSGNYSPEFWAQRVG